MKKLATIKEDTTAAPREVHDAPGLSPFERMTELARAVIAVPKSEVADPPKRKR